MRAVLWNIFTPNSALKFKVSGWFFSGKLKLSKVRFKDIAIHKCFTLLFPDSHHYKKKLTKNIRPTDILQIYTSI